MRYRYYIQGGLEALKYYFTHRINTFLDSLIPPQKSPAASHPMFAKMANESARKQQAQKLVKKIVYQDDSYFLSAPCYESLRFMANDEARLVALYDAIMAQLETYKKEDLDNTRVLDGNYNPNYKYVAKLRFALNYTIRLIEGKSDICLLSLDKWHRINHLSLIQEEYRFIYDDAEIAAIELVKQDNVLQNIDCEQILFANIKYILNRYIKSECYLKNWQLKAIIYIVVQKATLSEEFIGELSNLIDDIANLKSSANQSNLNWAAFDYTNRRRAEVLGCLREVIEQMYVNNTKGNSSMVAQEYINKFEKQTYQLGMVTMLLLGPILALNYAFSVTLAALSSFAITLGAVLTHIVNVKKKNILTFNEISEKVNVALEDITATISKGTHPNQFVSGNLAQNLDLLFENVFHKSELHKRKR